MLKKPPEIEYLRLNIDGNPTMIEEVTEFDALYRVGSGVLQFRLEWVFKIYETFRANCLITESAIHQDHQIKLFTEILHNEVKEIITASYEVASDLLENTLKSNEVYHRPKSLPQEELENWALKLHENLKKRLF